MTSTLRIGATGFGLIAVCYGFARFAFGLFLPGMRADLAFSATLAGVVSGGAFAAYCVAIIVSARLSERLGPRTVAVVAALVAGAGMTGMALAPSALWLAGFVLIAGASTGLASPPMADAVARAVPAPKQDATNTAINAGTSAGVALSGPVALVAGHDWRIVFAVFAAVAFALAAAAFLALPRHAVSSAGQAEHAMPAFNPNLWQLVGAALLMGAASTALWSFGGEIVHQRLDWSTTGAGLLWIAIGGAGVLGAAAGWLTERLGINTTHRLFLLALAGGLGLTGFGFTTPMLSLAGGALFGMAYVMLTGVYLVWGTAALPTRPGTGLMIGFLTIAVGQTVGAPLFGALMGHVSLQVAVAVFAGLALLPGVFGCRARYATGAAPTVPACG
ncbi:MFS transporter [Salinisphaera sp. Q1T1-3]|uniref:MFS transporter n=1 Tax=Salinisphaera sp. Q1T1-3 TaxID=2321229 RepID=UPI000E731D53|nr:MFS transporter [Salinisphaera sp. Q1T1-3]RJS93012.1 MFS transporter [Salinisphaera sp. Q1T1-3]